MSCGLQITPFNQVINATITVNRAAVSAELSEQNIKNFRRQSIARWDVAGGDVVITINLDSPEMASVFALVGSNLSMYGSSSLVLYDEANASGNAATYSDLKSSGYIPAGIWRAGIDPFGAKWPNQESQIKQEIDNKAWRSAVFTISDADNETGFIDIRSLVIGGVYSFNYSFGDTLSLMTETDIQRMSSGFHAPNNIIGSRVATVPMNFISKEERPMLSQIYKQYANEHWFISMRSWDGVLNDEYEFVAIPSLEGFTNSSINYQNTQIILKEA